MSQLSSLQRDSAVTWPGERERVVLKHPSKTIQRGKEENAKWLINRKHVAVRAWLKPGVPERLGTFGLAPGIVHSALGSITMSEPLNSQVKGNRRGGGKVVFKQKWQANLGVRDLT